MKIIPFLCGGIVCCSVLTIFSCTKSAKDAPGAAIAQTTANSSLSLSANADSRTVTGFSPGDTLVIKGDTSNGDQTAMVQTAFKDNTVPNFVSYTALGPTLSGNGGIDRSLMKFRIRDLSDSIRSNPPVVKKALLYLYQYHRPADQDPYGLFQNGDNSLELHRIVGDWDSHTVTWNTQPAVARGAANPLEDVVVIPSVVTPLPAGKNDNQAVDITDMINKIISTGHNEGFLLKLTRQGENAGIYGRAYGSYTCPVVSKRPRLILYF